jgi:glutamate dehydrogenase
MDRAPMPGTMTLDRLVEALVVELHDCEPETVGDFTRHLLQRGSTEFLEGRSLVEVVDEIATLYRLADEAPAGEISVRLHPKPGSPKHAVLHTVMTDRPFIVDTLREYLHSLDLGITHLLHPVFVFERDRAGRVIEAKARASVGPHTSVVHITMEGALDDQKLKQIEDEVRVRLSHVEAVTTDFPDLVERAAAIFEELDERKQEIPWRARELEEIQELLRWLQDPGFVFLGYRGYEIRPDESGRDFIQVEKGTGLGILRNEEESRYWHPRPVDELSSDLKARALGGPLLIVSKTNAEAPIRRRARMDYVGIKRLGGDGTVRGEHRFLGLFTAKAYSQDASTIPILRRKLREILQLENAPKGSHDHNLILETFNSMPKEELFLASVEELRQVIETVMETEGGDDVRVTARPDALGRGINVLVVMPKQRFSGDVRHQLQDALVQAYGGTLLNYHLALGQGDQARLHFYLTADPEEAEHVDVLALENVFRSKVRTWDERLAHALEEVHESRRAHELAERYRGEFSDEYQAAVEVRTAVSDIGHLEALDATGVQQTCLEELDPERPKASRLKIFAPRGTFVLSDVMPTLENLGFRVLDAYRHHVGGADGLAPRTIHVFQVQAPEAWRVDRAEAEPRVAAALRAARYGEAEDDRLNSLVLSCGLTWRQVSVLRAYAGYAFRIGAVASRLGAQRPITEYPESAALLFRVFEAHLDPALGDTRQERVRVARRRFDASLSSIRGIEDDRALRRLLELVRATLRTNYFRESYQTGAGPLALKIDCRSVEFMPEPRPKYEVYLRGPHTEASHLRMGDVARGGIRWSDRMEDFRVEVLGLVKTQRVKNAVIVPTGAKGSFISKRPCASREEALQAGVDSYVEFIRGMLEITDNVVDGEVAHPPDVTIHDGNDPYLVVAADKGTARLSDTANRLAQETGFWLGDAFASGGSQGYDHKKEAITARGAWECVRRHFRERDVDMEHEPFTVVGIGDMSGDVFGNGMLLSDQIQLVAAFDHRHIFVDPDPDPRSTWEERKRLFEMPSSSWTDYDPRALSEGGGVYERAEKEIHLSPQACERLGIESRPLNGEEVIRAILRAPVDLLWNGGIGTYVKASEETDAEVGDPENDRVRIDASELRAHVVGEGGNLGLTQRARVEYALAGGRLNTDALDNSGGVDMSDREVNLKILLDAALQARTIDHEARNDLLRECTDDVSAAVLSNNYAQGLAVSLDERRARSAPGDFLDALQRLEREGLLDPQLEFLPSHDELLERQVDGRGLTRPELSILLAYAKLHMKQWLAASSVPKDRAMLSLVQAYFPPRALAAVRDEELESHRLRDNIASTMLTNRFVDRMGATWHMKLMSETGHSAATIARTWYVASCVADADSLYAELRDADAKVRAGTQCQWYLEIAESLGRVTRWLLEHDDLTIGIADAIEWYREPVREIRALLPELLSGDRLEAFKSQGALYEMDGLDADPAVRLSTFRYLDEMVPIARLIRETEAPARLVSAVYLGIADDIDFPWLRGELDARAGQDYWGQRAARILNARLVAARSRISSRVLQGIRGDGEIRGGLEEFRHGNARALQRLHNVIEDVRGADERGLAALVVAVDAVDDLLGAVQTESKG